MTRSRSFPLAALGLALGLMTACYDDLLTPPSRQSSTLAPVCFREDADIYPENPGAGTISPNAAGGLNITGTAGDDVIVGGNESDSIYGMGGNDRICAGAGDDLATGGEGINRIDGEAGTDAADYSGSAIAIIANLATGRVRVGPSTDRVQNIENLNGSDYDDLLRGNDGPNRMVGAAGDDVFYSGAGADHIDGGPGRDEVNYGRSAVGVRITLNSGVGEYGEAAGDVTSNVEDMIGSAGADTLTGDSDANRLDGRAGADVLNGAGGNDRLLGGDGDDELFGGDGNDRMLAGSGVNIVDGGAGSDYVKAESCFDTVTNIERFSISCEGAADPTRSTIRAAEYDVVADGVSSTTITVQLVDADGNNLTAGGNTVVLSTEQGTFTDGSTSAPTLQAVDQSDGTYTLTLVSSTTVGRPLITATVNGYPISDRFLIRFYNGPLDHFVIEAQGGGDIPTQGTGDEFSIRITALDAHDNVVEDFSDFVVDLSYEGTSGGALLTSDYFSDGVVSVQVTIPVSGTVQIRAVGGGKTGLSNSFLVAGPPDAVADAVISASVPGEAWHAALNTELTTGSLLANDNRGFPQGDITSFGAVQCNDGNGSLNAAEGAVTANAAGSTLSLAGISGCSGGSLTVNADGSIAFEPPTNYTGLFVFDYRLTNTGGSADATVTLAVGVRPAAAPDTYNGGPLIGNVDLNTASGTAFSVSENDAGDQRTLTLGTTSGGTIGLNADGTFTYQPAAGFSGSAGFDYSVSNGFGTTAAVSVSLDVSTDRIWFVDQTASPGGNGTQASPFQNVSDITNSGSLPNPQGGDVFFVFENAAAYDGEWVLRNDQKLIGQDASQSLATISGFAPATHQALPAMNTGGNAVLLTSSDTTITLGRDNVLRGFRLGNALTALYGFSFNLVTVAGDVTINTNGEAISLQAATVSGAFGSVTSTGGAIGIGLTFMGGTVDFGTGMLSNADSAGLLIVGGSVNVSYGGAIRDAPGRLLLVDTHTGDLTLTGQLVTASGLGLIFREADGTYDLSNVAPNSILSGTFGIGIGAGSSGTFTFDADIWVFNPDGVAFVVAVNGATPTVTMNGPLTGSATHGLIIINGLADGASVNLTGALNGPGPDAVFMSGNSGGTVTFSGSDKALRSVLLSNNTGTSINFTNGGLAINGGVTAPFLATGGGTLSITGANNTIDLTSAAASALRLDGMTVGAGGITVSEVNVTHATTDASILLTGLTGGELTIDGGSVTASGAGHALEIAGGDANVTIGASLTKSTANPLVQASGRTGGKVVVSGALSCTVACAGINIEDNSGGSIAFTNATKTLSTGTSNAVTMTDNPGFTVSFSGNNLDIDTGTGIGISASGGGTLNVTGTGNTINATAATALSLDGVTPGSSLVFESINATGGANGIVLKNTGANGLTVTGTTSGNCGGDANPSYNTGAPYGTRTTPDLADCTGGTINGALGADGTTTGAGIYLENASSVSLTRMRLTGTHQNFGLRAIGSSNITLDNMVLDGVFGTDANQLEGIVAFTNASGSAMLSNSTFSGSIGYDVRVQQNSALNLNRLTLDNVVFLAQTAANLSGHLYIYNGAAGTLNVTVEDSRFMGARGEMLQFENRSGGTANLVYTNNVAFNEHSLVVPNRGNVFIYNGGNAADNASLTLSIVNNLFRGASGAAVAIHNDNGVGTVTGGFHGNIIGDAATSNSGSALGAGVAVSSAQRGKTRIHMHGNTISQYNSMAGIWLRSGGMAAGVGTNDGSLHAIVRANTLTGPGTNNAGSTIDGLRFENGSESGDQYTMCINAGSGGANALGSSFRGGGLGEPFRLTANTTDTNGTFKLTGYPSVTDVGTAADANIISTLRSLNGLVGGGFTDVPNATTTFTTNNAVGVTCDFN